MNVIDIAKNNSKNTNIYNILKDLEMDEAILTASLLINSPYDEGAFSDDINQLVKTTNLIINFPINNTKENSYEMYRNLLISMAKDYRVIIIALAYRLDFMQEHKKDFTIDRLEVGTQTLKIYAPLAHRLGLGNIKTELEELSLYYIDNEKFKEIVNYLKVKKDERSEILASIVNQIEPLIPSDFDNIKILSRNKSIYSIYNKTKDRDITELFDLQGIRIICENISECYAILGVIHSQFTLVPGRYKDYIAVKKPNLYQSLHTAVLVDDKYIVEIQIRTYEMDEIAEKGIAAHFLYKDPNNKDINALENQLHIFRDIISKEVELSKEHELAFDSIIYTFTPSGKIISLPSGATIIDFAYRIHSSVGENMVGALVNGKIKPLYSSLNNGDVVEIKRRKNAISCNEEWLDHVKTTQAKKKIKAFLRKKQNLVNAEKIEDGKLLLQGMVKKGLLEVNEDFEVIVSKLQRGLSYSTHSDLFIAIFDKKISLNKMQSIFKTKDTELKFSSLKTSKQSLEEIIIHGASGIKKEIAKCCYPVPGDEIIGLIASGKGVKIHKKDCPNIQSSHKFIDVEWNTSTQEKYIAKIVIHSADRTNLLSDFVNFLSKEKVSIQDIKSAVIKEQVTTNLFLLVNSSDELNKIVNKINKIDGVIYISRN